MGTWLRLLWSLAVREAARALLRHNLRSGLTALGITIGIAAVVWVVAIGRAGSERAEAQLAALGDSLVWVEAGSRSINGMRTGAHGTTSLTVDDLEAIRREVPLILRASPQVDGSAQVIYRDRNWNTRYRGVTHDYLLVKRWTIVDGAPFSDEQVTSADNVVLIGETVRQRLFGDNDAAGEEIRIGNLPFRVLGVLAAKGQSTSGQDQDDTMMIPYTTVQKKMKGRGYEWIDDIVCSAVSREAVGPAIDQVTALMRQRHRIPTDGEDDFNIRRPDELIKAQVDASNTLALLLICVASVSLLVGGVGVMNVMLASVAQRTGEIGLRLAVGAKAWTVQLQFLGEAVLISLFGGLLGITLGVGGSFVLGGLLEWPVAIPSEAVLLALAFSVSVGVFFGFYPARRAAHLDPIEALRHE